MTHKGKGATVDDAFLETKSPKGSGANTPARSRLQTPAGSAAATPAGSGAEDGKASPSGVPKKKKKMTRAQQKGWRCMAGCEYEVSRTHYIGKQ